MTIETSVEEHIAHHAAAIDDISKQMADQWDAIRRLDTKLDRIIHHLKAMQEEADSAPPASTPPPHY